MLPASAGNLCFTHLTMNYKPVTASTLCCGLIDDDRTPIYALQTSAPPDTLYRPLRLHAPASAAPSRTSNLDTTPFICTPDNDPVATLAVPAHAMHAVCQLVTRRAADLWHQPACAYTPPKDVRRQAARARALLAVPAVVGAVVLSPFVLPSLHLLAGVRERRAWARATEKGRTQAVSSKMIGILYESVRAEADSILSCAIPGAHLAYSGTGGLPEFPISRGISKSFYFRIETHIDHPGARKFHLAYNGAYLHDTTGRPLAPPHTTARTPLPRCPWLLRGQLRRRQQQDVRTERTRQRLLYEGAFPEDAENLINYVGGLVSEEDIMPTHEGQRQGRGGRGGRRRNGYYEVSEDEIQVV